MSASNLSPSLRRLLLLSMLLSALALWWPQDSAPTVDVSRAVASSSWPTASIQSGAALVAAPLPLPAELPAPVFEHAEFDPFIGTPTAPAVPAEPVLMVAPQPAMAMAPAPPLATAPPMNYRYLGQMVDPGGRIWHYLARAEASFAIEAGTRLDDGYVVQAIDTAGVRLHYPAMDVYAVIPVPLPANPVLSR